MHDASQPTDSLGHDGPSKGDGHFGYDGFALTGTPYDHVVEKYVVCQRVNSFFKENMKYEKDMCII